MELEVGRMKTYKVMKSMNKFEMFWNSLTLYYRCGYAIFFSISRRWKIACYGEDKKMT